MQLELSEDYLKLQGQGRPGSCVPGPRAAGFCNAAHDHPEVRATPLAREQPFFHKPMDSTPASKRPVGVECGNFAVQQNLDASNTPRGRKNSQLSPFPARKRHGSPRLEFRI